MTALADKLDDFSTIDEILEFVGPFEFDDGTQIANVTSSNISLVREHYKTILNGLVNDDQRRFDALEKAYIDTATKLADFEARISALET